MTRVIVQTAPPGIGQDSETPGALRGATGLREYRPSLVQRVVI